MLRLVRPSVSMTTTRGVSITLVGESIRFTSTPPPTPCPKKGLSNTPPTSRRKRSGLHPLFTKGAKVVQGKQLFNVVGVFNSSAPSTFLESTRTDVMKHVKGFGMPRGYPQSVAPGYGRFFGLLTLSSFFSNIAMSISTQALLGGFFAESTPQVWMIKDLAPSLIAAYLANRVGTYEMRPKYWLMVAAVIQQASSFADLLIPPLVSPEYFLPAAIATTFVKHNAVLMHFVARASILQHFATHQNLGEIQKKFNSFGMVNFTIASALGIGFTTLCGSFTAHFVAIVVASTLSVCLTFASTSHFAFRVLTPATGQLVVQAYTGWKWMREEEVVDMAQDESKRITYTTHHIPTPSDADALMGIGAAVPDNEYINKRLQINPLLCKTLAAETYNATPLLFAPILPFTIVMVQPPNASAYLALFIHRECPGEYLILAHLLAHSALKEAVGFDDKEEAWCEAVQGVLSSDLLFGFGQLACSQGIGTAELKIEEVKTATSLFHGPSARLPATPSEWLRETAILLRSLQVSGWDRTNFALDALDRRIALEDNPIA